MGDNLSNASPEAMIDHVGLEYMKRIEKYASEESRDDFWRWLYAQLGEYITMLALPRPSFVKLYFAYVGSYPPPPKYYCPRCFETKFSTMAQCDVCSAELAGSFFFSGSFLLFFLLRHVNQR